MFWNKIEVDSLNIVLKDNKPLFLEVENKVKLDISVSKNISARLNIIANSDCDITINLEKNSSLIVNSINKNNNACIIINLKEKANIMYNHSVLSTIDSVNVFSINHLENDSISNLNNNGINMNDGKLFFTINGCVPKELSNISCNQKSKIINYHNGNSKIIPNLIIDSNDIIASHAAYIGEIDNEVKFYMQTRGISKSDLEKAIYKAILLGTMDLQEEKEEFDKRINEWW